MFLLSLYFLMGLQRFERSKQLNIVPFRKPPLKATFCSAVSIRYSLRVEWMPFWPKASPHLTACFYLIFYFGVGRRAKEWFSFEFSCTIKSPTPLTGVTKSTFSAFSCLDYSLMEILMNSCMLCKATGKDRENSWL